MSTTLRCMQNGYVASGVMHLVPSIKVHAWAAHMFQYFFTQVRWSLLLLVQLDRLIRRFLSKYQSHHLAASVEHLYLEHANRGRGMMNLHHAYEQTVVGSMLILLNATVQDQILQEVVSHQLYLVGHRNRRYSNLQGIFSGSMGWFLTW